ncbi:MAG: RluA family pseudouridine synthase [Lachnospiraceae bacterium]
MKTKIIYDDNSILVCYKPAGLPTQTASVMAPDMVSELKNYLRRSSGNGAVEPYVGLVHRLDQPVEGLLVFGKTQKAAATLSVQLNDGTLHKMYLAVTDGIPQEKEAVLTDYLLKDSRDNSSRVVPEGTKGAKRAELSYRVLSVETASATEAGSDGGAIGQDNLALLEIDLKTGRHHQIRVQMAHMGCPLLGDRKYGRASQTVRNPALCASRLVFRHPQTGREMKFAIEPEGEAFVFFTEKTKTDF